MQAEDKLGRQVLSQEDDGEGEDEALAEQQGDVV
jgi:hypothetical protein